jgi:coenzyme F420-0:L-glutamate ligase / coenzyme F420-1:gamma-L-glutamate ligase
MPDSTAAYQVTVTAVPHIPAVKPGDNVAALILTALREAGLTLQTGDLLVIAHKIISKAEGRLVNLAAVQPGAKALETASLTDKDPRLVELILQESDEISRLKRGVLIVRHRLGFTSANAGIDRSNVSQDQPGEWVLLLPEDPDASAQAIREQIVQQTGVTVGVVINDSHGRPFRLGTVGTAVGVAGLPALWDRRGEADMFGYRLQHTEVGLADEIAAAASLIMGQAAEGTPVVLIRGLELPPGDGRAADLLRPKQMDMYR